MFRTRLVWFSLGFAFTSGATAQFIFKDLWAERNSLASQFNRKFNSLDARVSNLESAISNKPTSSQIYGKYLSEWMHEFPYPHFDGEPLRQWGNVVMDA